MMMNIRPQYHFRRSGSDLLAWDVRNLIALSKDFPVREHLLSEIAELEENHWYQHGNVTPTCSSLLEHFKLIEAADLDYPIILDASGRVMDGMHRVCKAHLLKRPAVPAVQFEVDPEPDYRNVEPEALPYNA